MPLISLDKVLCDLDQNDIRLFPYHLDDAQGVTIELSGRYGIFIDPFRIGTTAELLHVLAHEIGHCATGATHAVHSPYELVAKHEAAANRWAVRRYLPFAELDAAVCGGCTEPWQLAEAFGLPEPFVRFALDYYLGACGLSFTSALPNSELTI